MSKEAPCHITSHQRAPARGLTARRRSCLYGRRADVLERRLHELTRYGRALHVSISPHFLRDAIRFLGVDDPIRVLFGPQVTLQAEYQDGKGIDALKRLLDFVEPLRPVSIRREGYMSSQTALDGYSYPSLDVDEAEALTDIEAKHDHVGVE